MRRLVYRPEIEAYVRITDTNQVVDITDDISNASITRRLNAVSTATLQLQNRGGRYTRLFKPMDVIVIYLTRFSRQLVFSGYLDETPLYQHTPGPVTLQASCTLKLLQNTYFDPGLPFMQTFFTRHGFLYDFSSGQLSDAQARFGDFDVRNGWAAVLRAVLTDQQLGRWNPNSVHITGLPENFLKNFTKAYEKSLKDNAADFVHLSELLGSLMNAGADSGIVPGTSIGATAKQFGSALARVSTQLSAEQIHNASVIYQVAKDEKLSDLVAIGLIAATMNESTLNSYAYNPNGGATGLFQLVSDSYYGPTGFLAKAVRVTKPSQHSNPVRSKLDPVATNPEYNTRAFIMANRNINFNSINNDVWAAEYTAAGIDVTPINKSSEPYKQIIGYWLRPGVGGAKADIKQAKTIWGDLQQALIGLQDTVDRRSTDPSVNPNQEGPADPRKSTVTNSNTTGVIGATHDLEVTVNGVTFLSSSADNAHLAGVQLSFLGSLADALKLGSIDRVKVISGKRTTEDNSGVKNSNHLTGDAMDGTVTYNGASLPLGTALKQIAQANNKSIGSDGSIPGWGLRTGDVPNFYGSSNRFSSAGNDPSHVDDGANSGGVSGGAQSILANNASSPLAQLVATDGNNLGLFTLQLQGVDSVLSSSLMGNKALANDVSLFDWFQTMTTAGGRVFTSLPNGDFYAFFPDYFGWFGERTAYFQIEDIEIVDLTIQLSDRDLHTHVFSTGTLISWSDAISEYDRLFPQVASVEEAAFNVFINPTVKGEHGEFSPEKFLKRYGARPFAYDAPEIRHPLLLWMAAWMKFAELWAAQYTAEAELSFLPELFPGGLVRIAGQFTMFVDEVTHECDRTNGFSTTATLKAPSEVKKKGEVFGPLLLQQSFNETPKTPSKASKKRTAPAKTSSKKPTT